ncbi:hypothetical protein [Actinomadura sp. 9N215]|uniref:hypothetical protein n=1 Tax=Actinomadura sp. 9N215 TaxID=3375150 RepID=UPI00379AE1FD
MADLVTKVADGRLPADAVGTALRDLDWSMNSGKLHPNSYGQQLGQLNRAGSEEQFRQYYAEVRAVRDVIESGDLAPGTKVLTHARGGKISDDLGDGTHIDVHPVSQADLLYKSRDGRIHVEDVKDTPNALQSKMKSGEQHSNMLEWGRVDQASRFIGYRIPNEDGWTGLFHGRPDTMERLIKDKMSLTIGRRTYDPVELKSIRRTVARKLIEWTRANPGAPISEFYGQPEMRTVEEAMRHGAG